jgi:hypothetical protein
MDRVTVNRNLHLPQTGLRDKSRTWRLGIGRNSRGFWLAVCLAISAVAGWLMFYFGILQ